MLLKFDPVQLFYPIRNLCHLHFSHHAVGRPDLFHRWAALKQAEISSNEANAELTAETIGVQPWCSAGFPQTCCEQSSAAPPPILPLRPHQRYCSSHRHSLWLQRCSWLSSDRLSRAEGFPTFLWSLNVDAHFNDWRAQRTSRVRMEITWRHTDSSDRSL